MKRKMIFAVGLIMMTTAVGNATKYTVDDIADNANYFANEPFGIYLNLRVRYTDPAQIKVERPKSPIAIPSVYIDDHTIYTNGYPFDEISLVAMDNDGEETVVYSSAVPSGTETIEIPDGITGEYEIRLYNGDWCFYGEIIL